MIEEAAGFLVELEVEDLEVLSRPLIAHGLRDSNDIALDQPAEQSSDCLRRQPITASNFIGPCA